jgi:7,8-dihydropterin-6-yl-methyl-4-(beta-D-ribofuranosyl)aminobenzene 5'-phosphate synthase
MFVVGLVAGVGISSMLFVKTLIMTTVYSSITLAERMRMVVLVDNNPYRQDLEKAWGLSAYIETSGVRLLFDTGPDPIVLEANARRLGIDLSKIDFVVISHAHGDHTGGLRLLASIKPGITVYVPPDGSLVSYVRSLGLKPIQVNNTVEVSRGVYVVKPLYGPPIEEALAIKTGKELIILVGCSHPGVVNIVEQAMRDIGVKPYIVLGGISHGKILTSGCPESCIPAHGDGCGEDIPLTLQR